LGVICSFEGFFRSIGMGEWDKHNVLKTCKIRGGEPKSKHIGIDQF
jgi:hypothetical protein